MPWKHSGFLDRSTGRLIIDENDSPVNPYVFRVVEAKWGPRTNLNRFTSYYRALSFRFLTPSLLLLVVGVSDAFVRDWSGKDNWIFFPVCLVVAAWFEPDLAMYARFGALICAACEPDLAYFLAWFGIIVSLIWRICEPDLAHLWACLGLSCESDLAYQWACFSLFLSLIGHVSSHFGVGSFWAYNIIFSILLCANILLSASLVQCFLFS